jgi:hypothetical protein
MILWNDCMGLIEIARSNNLNQTLVVFFMDKQESDLIEKDFVQLEFLDISIENCETDSFAKLLDPGSFKSLLPDSLLLESETTLGPQLSRDMRTILGHDLSARQIRPENLVLDLKLNGVCEVYLAIHTDISYWKHLDTQAQGDDTEQPGFDDLI